MLEVQYVERIKKKLGTIGGATLLIHSIDGRGAEARDWHLETPGEREIESS